MKENFHQALKIFDETGSEKFIAVVSNNIGQIYYYRNDFERAIQYNQKVEDIATVKEGFELIYNKMSALLKRFEIEEIPAMGETFNTDYHEAITHFPAQSEEMKGKVMDVTEKGYKIKDKVIRFSKVIVAN